MSKSQLRDFAHMGGGAQEAEMTDHGESGEHSPVKFLKREGISLEGSEASSRAGKGKKFSEADYVSGSKSSFNERNEKTASFYKEHGVGNHYEESEEYNEDKIQKGSTPNLDH